jgi:hypothetical protein
MNKTIQLFFLILFPFYPFWARFFFLFTHTPIGIFITLIFTVIAFYYFTTLEFKLPKYLIFFILFTFYHLASVYLNNLIPSGSNWIKVLLYDRNVLACVLFLVIENTHFEDSFIRTMNRNIFILVLISLLICLIQIKHPFFFVTPNITDNIEEVTDLLEGRIYSIYSWVNINSLGITFPILIAILLSTFSNKKMALPLIVISGIVVSFLTKTRYVMISALIVFSQFFFISKIKLKKKVYILIIFTGSIVISLSAAKILGYDIQQVIDDRILEKSTDMGSASARILSYYVFLKKFPEHPLIGVGPETRQDVLQLLGGVAPLIHIGYLSYLYYYGIVGCLFLFLSIIYLLRDAWIVGRKYEFWAGFYGFLSFCFANTTFVYFNFSEMGIVLVIIYLRYFNEKSSLEGPISNHNHFQKVQSILG